MDIDVGVVQGAHANKQDEVVEAERELHHTALYVLLERQWHVRANRRADAYIIFHVLLGSVVMYGGSDMPYIDALFFASGSATQSGLNT